ncbi:NUDIX domain-containing protein [Thiomonas intermedia]|uniref:NUDIX domain-containing protein n=1 Tax=Thiomonas intermedia TaxID=926 RepID=UPI0009A4F4B2|nr:NUDIX hydrolase [Thiomonas intermedia]
MSGDPARAPQAAALREHTLDSEMVFRGTFLNISRDLVRLANGAQVTREYIRHSGAVMIIPLLDNGNVLMERQFRTPMQRVMVEFPAGKLDAGESWLACAQRELREETGYSAREWAYIGPINNAISYSDETIHLAFARGLVAGAQALDDNELLDVFEASPHDTLAWVRSGQITDVKTVIGAFWLEKMLQNAWSFDWQPSA